jgi:hypothetical protein
MTESSTPSDRKCGMIYNNDETRKHSWQLYIMIARPSLNVNGYLTTCLDLAQYVRNTRDISKTAVWQITRILHENFLIFLISVVETFRYRHFPK